jgi:3'-5' exoribonuclease
MKIYVSDLKNMKDGSIVESVFLVARKEVRPFVEKPGSYLYLILKDKSGTIEGICWDDAEKIVQFDEDDLIALRGEISYWKGEQRLIIQPNSIERLSFDDVDWRDFVPSTDKNVDQLVEELFECINSVENPILQKLLRTVFEDKEFLEIFKNCPAAVSHHHNYLGGLIEHTVSVAKMCTVIAPLYPELDKDLLLTGALLHDIGKVREYKWMPRISITVEGGFAGHPALGAHMLSKKFPQDFPEDLKIKIYHMILSHHGEAEFGAAVQPKFAEAYALHLAEYLDAKLNEFLSIERKAKEFAKESGGKREWSYARSLGRFIYAGGIEETNETNSE